MMVIVKTYSCQGHRMNSVYTNKVFVGTLSGPNSHMKCHHSKLWLRGVDGLLEFCSNEVTVLSMEDYL